LVHDLNDSKLRLLDAVKQFHDRGLHVAVFDLRAHGESEGKIFSPGMIAVEDLKHVTDALLRRAETKHICLMGYGIGSAIVLQSAVVDGRADALVLQSPFANLENYLARYAYAKWGRLKPLWYPVFHRKTEQLLGHPVEAMDLPLLASVVKTPTLVVTGSEDELVFPTESLAVFDSSAAPKKDLLLIRKAGHQNIDELGGAEYYNRIAAFLVTAVPRKQQKTRFKRLAQL
jgi:alpha-beta hydrolase superfamily lysophospholipase